MVCLGVVKVLPGPRKCCEPDNSIVAVLIVAAAVSLHLGTMLNFTSTIKQSIGTGQSIGRNCRICPTMFTAQKAAGIGMLNLFSWSFFDVA